MSIPIISVCSHPEYATKLYESATKRGWTIHIVKTDWRGFGTKIIETYNFLKEHPEITSFVFADAFDVIVLNKPFNFINERDIILFSTEKGCWPDGSLRDEYPETESPFRFLNSGLYFADSKKWMQMVEKNPIEYHDDDQLYFTKLFLSGKYGIELDDFQNVFNSHSFVGEGEYIYYDNSMLVKIGDRNVLSRPHFAHFNGKTVDPEFDKNITI